MYLAESSLDSFRSITISTSTIVSQIRTSSSSYLSIISIVRDRISVYQPTYYFCIKYIRFYFKKLKGSKYLQVANSKIA